MEESTNDVNTQLQEEAITPATASPQTTPSTTFTKVDNNLTGIGFFTASSKRSRKEIEKTTVVVDHGIERRISILPSAKYGLPITQDQDYWLALMKLVSEYIQRNGKLTNPFTFSTAELQQILGQSDAGKNYKAVQEWLSVMKFTGIEGGAYNAGKKKWITNRISAVDRAATVGEQISDGTIADKNYVWFSEWQLDNINAGNLIAVELDTYIQLANNISKNLVPHLQEWLYASQHDGHFEKQYEDVCQLLGIRTYRYRSQIEEQLRPSLDELANYGYISRWALEPMADRKHYKLMLWHGQKYHRDRKTRLEKKSRIESLGQKSSPPAHRPRQQHLHLKPVEEQQTPTPDSGPTIINYSLVAELEKRGIGGVDARNLLRTLAPGQPVLDQLEYGDVQIEQSRGKITNPPGFYISLLQRNVPVPPTFESPRIKKARQEAILAQEHTLSQEREAVIIEEQLQIAAIDSQIALLPAEAQQALFDQAKAELLAQYPKLAQFFKANPDNVINDGAIRVRMRNFIVQGWAFQRTTSADRQSSTVQESSPVVLTYDLKDLSAILTRLQLTAPMQDSLKQSVKQEKPASSDPVW